MNTSKISCKKHFKALAIVGILLVTNTYINAYAGVQSVKITQTGTQITFTDNTGYWLEY